MPAPAKPIRFIREALRRLIVVIGAVVLVLAFFMVLPLMQTLAQSDKESVETRQVATIAPPPPPPEIEEPPEPEEPDEEPPPSLDEAPPLSLDDISLTLAPTGSGWSGAGLGQRIQSITGDKESMASLFSMSDLDKKPRVLYQAGPKIDDRLRRRAPAQVSIIFIVDERGRVQNPIVQRTSDPAFNQAALSAVKNWRFEPGERKGEPVRFRMRVPIEFPKPKG